MAKALYPTIGTAKPSASVEDNVTDIGFPALIAFEKLGHLSDSTPYKKIIQFIWKKFTDSNLNLKCTVWF